MLLTNLDMDVLRTFATGMALGSFAKAADRLGRSQSAISLQLRKLEAQTGETLLRKEGRGLVLTPAGEVLMSYARRILDLNDEALAAVRGAGVAGWIRVGIVEDFAESWLPGFLGRFGRAHPGVRIDARVDRTYLLAQAVERGELDLALVWGAYPGPRRRHVAELPLTWIGRPGFRHDPAQPLPLIGFEQPCFFRSAAMEALDRAGISWRLAFTSPSLSGIWAAAEAGLGVAVRTASGVPGRLALLTDAGLPPLPSASLWLHGQPDQDEAVRRLEETLLETLAAALPQAAPSSANTSSA